MTDLFYDLSRNLVVINRIMCAILLLRMSLIVIRIIMSSFYKPTTPFEDNYTQRTLMLNLPTTLCTYKH